MEQKRTLQEKAEAILHQTLACGCLATDCGTEGLVVLGGHTCDGTVLAAQREARIDAAVKSAEESYQRASAPLYRKPFSLLR